MSVCLREEPSFSEITKMILRRWKLFCLVVFVCVIASILLLRVLPQKYTVTMIVGPTATDGVAGRGARLTLQTTQTELFRPAAVETDRNESLSDFSRFLELLTAPDVIEAIDHMQEGQLLKTLYHDQWDSKSQTWHPPLSVGYIVKAMIKGLVGQKSWSAPNYAMAAKDLQSQLKIEPVGMSAMRKIVYRHDNADFAIELLDALYHQTDSHLKTQAKKRTKEEIDYLKTALNRISVLEHRKALTSLLAMQEQTQMMIAVDLPFAADQIKPATAPSIPDWPNSFAVLAIFLAMGICFGVFGVYLVETIRE